MGYRLPSPGIATADRTLALLTALVRDGGASPLRMIAAELGLPSSTVHRMASLLIQRGLIVRVGRGQYGPGLALVDLAASADSARILTEAARPLLSRLARRSGATAHLGVWDHDMVTYLVKEEGRNSGLFTQEGGQLEAYCSAIGKVLLAHLDPDGQEAYLAAGPFIALTERTVIRPDRIRRMIAVVKTAGYAVDVQEIAEDLCCMAVPVRRWDGGVVAAISLSWMGREKPPLRPPPELQDCADAISTRLGFNQIAK